MSLWRLETTEALFEIVTMQNLSTWSPTQHRLCKLTPIYERAEATGALRFLLAMS